MDIEKLKSGLYICPTPIGNKEDISFRTLKVLAGADYIACEDTRNTGSLLKLLDLPHKKLISYHDFNEKEKSQHICNLIKDGASVALVSDCGTPCISDPGYHLVNAAIDNEIYISALPGATAFATALSASGLKNDAFTFVGFPPQKKGRQTFLKEYSKRGETVIFYESPNRILKLIDELIEKCGEDRKACLAREISKMFEEYIRGSLVEIKNELLKKTAIKGEIVFLLAGVEKSKKGE